MKLGTLYLVQAGSSGPIKIGFTYRTLIERVRELQTGASAPLRVLASAPAPEWIETELHSALADIHVYGEWFEDGLRLRRLARAVNDVAPVIEPHIVADREAA